MKEKNTNKQNYVIPKIELITLERYYDIVTNSGEISAGLAGENDGSAETEEF